MPAALLRSSLQSVIWAAKAASALLQAVPFNVITAQNLHELVLETKISNERHELLLNYMNMSFQKADPCFNRCPIGLAGELALN